jgi:hypothetical protein
VSEHKVLLRRQSSIMKRTTACLLLLWSAIAVVFAAPADDKSPPGGKWPAHSMERPRPKVVPAEYDGTPVPPPAGAVVLLDGANLDKWKSSPKKGATNASDAAKWKLTEGFMQVVPGAGTVVTRETLKGNFHLHLEWATPAEVKGKGQGRGNSGVFIGGFPEVQVLDSWENDTYPDGQAAALYGRQPPLVNASRRPGEWQCYDIIVERAKVENGKIVKKAAITVRHNNVLVQDRFETDNRAQEGTLNFQDHGNPIRFRNIWYKPLP